MVLMPGLWGSDRTRETSNETLGVLGESVSAAVQYRVIRTLGRKLQQSCSRCLLRQAQDYLSDIVQGAARMAACNDF